MKSIVTYFIKSPIAANLLMIAILLFGFVGLSNIKRTMFPEESERFIVVRATYLGASPEEIEEGVVQKIEEALKGTTGIERVTSTSTENSGSVTVEMVKDGDLPQLLRDVKNAVDGINSFPAAMEPPTVFKAEILGLAMSFALSGDVDLKTLKQFARKVEDDLLSKEGISKISIAGYPEEEIEIAFREADLRAYKITFDEASRAVAAANLELSGGTIKGEKEEFLVRARNKNYFADDLRDIILKTTPNGGVIRLNQVATVRDRWADPNSPAATQVASDDPSLGNISSPNLIYLNHNPSVVLTVQNTLSEDVLYIARTVKEYIEEFNEKNEVVKATVIRDESINLEDRIELLTKNGLQGFLLVVIFLAMFLNWRLAFWVALSIPISFAGMFMLAGYFGISINVISTFGMIMVLGILVDDGIVIAESIYQKYEKGMNRFDAAVQGTIEIFPAVFSAILTTAIAFSAFFFIDGKTGDFFSQIAAVVILSLVFSLVEGAFILPTHVSHSAALAPNKKKNKFVQKLDDFMVWLRDKLYAPVLRFALVHKFLTISLIVGIFMITIGAMQGGIIQSTFFPNIEVDVVSVNIKMPSGTRANVTMDWLDHIEKAAEKVDKEFSEKYFNGEKKLVKNIQKSLGSKDHIGSISVILLEVEQRDSITSRLVANAIRDKSGTIFGAESATFGSGTIFGKPISISIVGNNYEELNKAVEDVKSALSKESEIKDIVDTNQEGTREINIQLTEKAKYLGLNLMEIVGQVRQGFFGAEVQRLQRGRDEVRVWVRYDEKDRRTISDLEQMRVRFRDGREFPLNEIATLDIKRGVTSITHLDGKREIRIDADISNDEVSVADLTAKLQTETIPPIMAKYSSAKALFEGQNREQAKTGESFGKVMPIVLLLMFFAIALTFRSISQTMAVLLIIPFCIVGVGWGHWFMGFPISMLSNLGTLALIGILVNDALVFITTYNQNLKEGQLQSDAIYNAGLSRFRPIILTSITTVMGLLPLLLEKSFGAQFLKPMATSVAYGLMFITAVILILLPVLIVVFNRFKVYASYAWNGKKPTYEAVESATEENGGYEFLWYLLIGIIIFIGILGSILR